LEERSQYIKKVVLLIDTKIGLQQKDIDMFGYVQKLKIPVIIVLSKTDRLSKSETLKAKNYVEKELFGQQIMPVSSHKKI
jgi:GTP-binding protein